MGLYSKWNVQAGKAVEKMRAKAHLGEEAGSAHSTAKKLAKACAEALSKGPPKMPPGSLMEYAEIACRACGVGPKRGKKLEAPGCQSLKHIFIALAEAPPEAFAVLFAPNEKLMGAPEAKWWLAAQQQLGPR